MDMLDFETDKLYFDQPIADEAQQNINRAADNYSKDDAESPLMRAYFLEPEHPLVLVALYRYFYYQHRLKDALLVAERVLLLFADKLALPGNWQELKEKHLHTQATASMELLRFYLLALKGAGYLELRLGEFKSATARLKKVVELDSEDRLGAQALLNIAIEKQQAMTD